MLSLPIELIKIIYEFANEPNLLFTCKYLFEKNIHKKGVSFNDILSCKSVYINDTYENFIPYISGKNIFAYLCMSIVGIENVEKLLMSKNIPYKNHNSFIAPITINNNCNPEHYIIIYQLTNKILLEVGINMLNSAITKPVFKKYLL